MMFMKSVVATLVLFSAPCAFGFSVQSQTPRMPTSLQMKPQQDSAKHVAASVVAAAFIMANTVGVAPAAAFDDLDLGTSQVVAAKSGGRVGGRARSASSMPSSRPSSTVTNTRVINRTTYVSPPPVYSYSSPSVIVAPPVYNPMPGLGLGLGLNAVNQIGNDMRDYRQETEIQRTKADLEASKAREAMMEQRLRDLEMNQARSAAPVYQQQVAPQMAPVQ